MPPSAFIALLLPAAQACQRAHGIPASFTLAQAALESGWGERAPGNNLFGVKADRAWKGPTVDVPTHEVIKGVRVPMVCKFRKYATLSDSVADRADFFLKNPRYKDCFKQRGGEAWARAVAAAGYATDPSYEKSLVAVMRGRNMAQYDILPAVKA